MELLSEVEDMKPGASYLTCESFSEELLVSFLVDHGETAIDVGAGSGRLTRFLSARSSKVHAFECNPKHINAIENGVRGAWDKWSKSSNFQNIILHKKAASSTDGIAILRAPSESYGWGTIDSSNQLLRKKEEGIDKFKVSMCRIDTIGHSLENVGFLKVDVEGHEPAVLAGAEQLLKRFGPILYLEIYDGHVPGVSEKIQEYLRGHGYKGFYLHNDQILPIEQCDFARHLSAPPSKCDINFIFIKDPAHKARISKFITFSQNYLGKTIEIMPTEFAVK